MKILVTGGEGTIGKALREFLPDAAYLPRQLCDVTNDRHLSEVFNRERPDVVIHAAAITDHQTPDIQNLIRVNIQGTELVARWCRAFGCKMVYLSTHYVYPGETGNYKETDETRPIGVYAQTKLAGEGWAQMAPEWLIVRGSWYTYETRLKNWLERGALVDAFCSRDSAFSAASKIAHLVTRGASGTYNVGRSRRSFASILEDNGYDDFRRCNLASGGLSLPYKFPPDSSVNIDKHRAFVLANP